MSVFRRPLGEALRLTEAFLCFGEGRTISQGACEAGLTRAARRAAEQGETNMPNYLYGHYDSRGGAMLIEAATREEAR